MKALNTWRAAWRKLFHRLTDAIPVPIWIVSPEGRLILGNARWGEIASDEGGRAAKTPNGPTRSTLTIANGRSRRSARPSGSHVIRLELRLRVGHDVYSRSACIGAPNLAIDGRLEGLCRILLRYQPQRRANRR